MLRTRASWRGRRAGWTDDGGLRRSLRHIWFDHLRVQDGDHVHANSTCIGNEDSLQRHVITVPPDNVLALVGSIVTETPNLSDEIDRRIRAGLMCSKRYTRGNCTTQAYSGILSTCKNSRPKLALKRHWNVHGVLFGGCRMLRTHASWRGRRAGWTDDGSLRRSLRHIWFDHLRVQDGDHVHANSTCIGNE